MSSREKRERAAPQRFETGFKVSEPVAVAAGAGTALQDIEASCGRSSYVSGGAPSVCAKNRAPHDRAAYFEMTKPIGRNGRARPTQAWP